MLAACLCLSLTMFDWRSLETSGRLMELNTKDGRLRVSYSDRLVTLVREVRMLLQRGFAVPAKIQHVAQVADKFKLHANILKQVRFHTVPCLGTVLRRAKVLHVTLLDSSTIH